MYCYCGKELADGWPNCGDLICDRAWMESSSRPYEVWGRLNDIGGSHVRLGTVFGPSFEAVRPAAMELLDGQELSDAWCYAADKRTGEFLRREDNPDLPWVGQLF